MLIALTDPQTWSIRHGVPLETDKCLKCGRIVKIDRPVITKDFVGFESEAHECGQSYVISLLKPRSPELQNLMSEAY